MKTFRVLAANLPEYCFSVDVGLVKRDAIEFTAVGFDAEYL